MFRLIKTLRLGLKMHRAVHVISMLLVLAHMACGCCLHHAHAYGLQSRGTPAAETSCHCSHHGHEDGGEPGDHQPCDQGCDHDQCVFARVQSGGTSQVSIDADCVPLVSVVPSPPSANGIDTADSTEHHFGPPIPLHLLNQALLL
jgi:hypothetical protein